MFMVFSFVWLAFVTPPKNDADRRAEPNAVRGTPEAGLKRQAGARRHWGKTQKRQTNDGDRSDKTDKSDARQIS